MARPGNFFGQTSKRKDLISLVWPVNTCTSKLIAGVPKGVTVDIKAGIWTFLNHTYQLGLESRHHAIPCKGSPVGVYDRTKIEHLTRLHEDIIWVERRNGPPGN